MKIFPATIHWADVDGTRTVTLKTGEFAASFAAKDGVEPVTTFTPPESQMDPENPPDEIIFLAALFAALKTPLVLFLAGPEKDRIVALASLHKFSGIVLRDIEHTPRAAEKTLELHMQCEMSGIPLPVGLMLLGDEIEKGLVTPASEFEKALMARVEAANPETLDAALEHVASEMPPLTYTHFFPDLPAGAKEAYEQRAAAMRLATAVPTGPAH